MKLPTEQEVTLYIHLDTYGSVFISSSNHTESGIFGIVIGEHKVTVPIPQNADLVALEVEQLEIKSVNIRNEYHLKLAVIEDRINSLKALEHKEYN